METLWHPQVLQISALLNRGVDAFWAKVSEFRGLQTRNGKLADRRQQQALSWMWERIDAGLKHAFKQHAAVRDLLPDLTAQVASGQLPASTAARQLLQLATVMACSEAARPSHPETAAPSGLAVTVNTSYQP